MVFVMKSTILLCALVAVSEAAPGYQRPDPHGLSEYLSEAPRGYRFAFSSKDTESNQHREETADHNGHVKGSYSFDLPDGTKRHVRYIADEGGFRVKIDSNEAGLQTKDPADVKFVAQSKAQPKRERSDGHSAAQAQGWANGPSAPQKTSGWSSQPPASLRTSERFDAAPTPPKTSSTWSEAPRKSSGWSDEASAPSRNPAWSEPPASPLKAQKWSDAPRSSSEWPGTPSAPQRQANKQANEIPAPVKNNGWSDEQSEAPLTNPAWSTPAYQRDSWSTSRRQVLSDSDGSPASDEWSRPSAASKQPWPEAAQQNAWTDDKASRKQDWTPKSAPIRRAPSSDSPANQRGWTPSRFAAILQDRSSGESGAQKVPGWQSDSASAPPKDSWSKKNAAVHQAWPPQKSAVIGQGCADESADLKQPGWSESAAQEQKPWSEKSPLAGQGRPDNTPKNQGWANEAQDYAPPQNTNSGRREDPKFERLTAESAGQKSNVRLELPHADKVEWFAPPAFKSAALNQKW